MPESFKKSKEQRAKSEERKEFNPSLLTLFFLRFALCALLFASFAFADPPSPFAGENLLNQPAPEFKLKDVNGSEVSLASYKGNVVLLNFWATWCPTCTEEMPSLNKLSRQLKNRKFSVIAVSTDRSVTDVKDFVKTHPLDFTVLVDRGLSVSRSLYKVFVLPTSFLIDKKGVIVERYYGEEDWVGTEMVRKIESLF